MKQENPGGISCEAAQRMIALRAMTPDPSAPAHDPADLYAAGDPDVHGLEGTALDELAALLLAEEALTAAMPPAAGQAGVSAPSTDALDAHLAQCRACQAEMAETAAFFRALAADRHPEPSPTLLARARMRLDASLDSCERAGLWTRVARRFSFAMGRLRAAPVLSSALLFLGVIAGGYGGYRLGDAEHNSEQATLLLAPPPQDSPSIIADVSSIRRDPDTGLVEIRYDRLVPDVMTAAPGDPSIRELLMAGAETGIDPSVRDASLSLLARPCAGAADCAQSPIRAALLNALANDKAPEVRREALAGLQPFIADDVGVRDAVLDTLMNDPSASVRMEAVRMLQPVDVDSSVRQVLNTVATRDGDPRIRVASMQVLKTMPDLQ